MGWGCWDQTSGKIWKNVIKMLRIAIFGAGKCWCFMFTSKTGICRSEKGFDDEEI
jgi:hypothetical protein